MPQEKPSALSNALAVVGLILVLIIVIWGLIHLATLLSPWFASLFASKPTPTVQIQAPTSTVVVQPSSTPPQVVKKQISAPAPQGPADLSVKLISASIDPSGWGTVVFDIANEGTGNSGAYSFEVFIPTTSTYTYYSPAQVSLAPGSHIVNTLRFTQAISGGVSIIVDPATLVQDANRANNYAGVQMTAPYGLPGQGYAPQPYNGNYLPGQAGYPQPYLY